MPIEHIKIENYKSLECLSLDMRPFMTFVGPNNSGKSNIFDALLFLSDFVKEEREARRAVQERGGFGSIVYDGDLGRSIRFEVSGTVDVRGEKRSYRYKVELSGDRFGNWFNDGEKFVLEEGRELLRFSPEEGTALAWDETGRQTGSIGAGRNHLYSCLYHFSNVDKYPILGRFVEEVRSWSLFNFLPPFMRGSVPVRRELRIQTSGENLALVLHVLQTEYPEKFREIEEVLRTAIPELEELTTALTVHEPGQTYVRLRERGLRMSVPAWGMSDGTLRFLAHLAVVYSPDPPSLMCFEEPENYIHPGLSELMVDLLKSASYRTQVLVSTHSPYIVDHLESEDLFIVEKEEGRTKVKKAEDEEGIREALKNLGLGEVWYAGSLGGVP